jgi:hypothetical protein
VIQKARFNALIPVLIVAFILVGAVPALGACPCPAGTVDQGEQPRGIRAGYPQPHGCCNGGKLTLFDSHRGCPCEAPPCIRAALPRVEVPVPVMSSALSAESPLFPTIVSCLSGRDLSEFKEASGRLDSRNLPLRC